MNVFFSLERATFFVLFHSLFEPYCFVSTFIHFYQKISKVLRNVFSPLFFSFFVFPFNQSLLCFTVSSFPYPFVHKFSIILSAAFSRFFFYVCMLSSLLPFDQIFVSLNFSLVSTKHSAKQFLTFRFPSVLFFEVYFISSY